MSVSKSAKAIFSAIIRNEEGVTAIEYGLIAGLISILIAASAFTIGGDLSSIFASIVTAVSTAI